jgi:hypothetical protein
VCRCIGAQNALTGRGEQERQWHHEPGRRAHKVRFKPWVMCECNVDAPVTVFTRARKHFRSISEGAGSSWDVDAAGLAGGERCSRRPLASKVTLSNEMQ